MCQKEHVRDPSAKVTVQNSSWKLKKTRRRGERPFCQRACSGRLVSSSDTVFRRIPVRSDSRVPLGKGLAFLTTKNTLGSVEVEFEIKTALGQSAMWKRYFVQLESTILGCDLKRVVGQIYTVQRKPGGSSGDRWKVTNLLLSWSKAAWN